MDKKAIDQMYADKKTYVELVLGTMLRPMDRFGDIQYARDILTGEEFVKVTEADGYPWYINVTGNSLQAIGEEICGMIGAGHFVPHGCVTSREKQRAVNKMFER